jgi:hypothetical protein
MTLTKELQYRKTALISAQREFTKNPSATNWNKVMFQMEYYQLIHTKAQDERESKQLWKVAA